jgi:PAS domain S-box-containing protein
MAIASHHQFTPRIQPAHFSSSPPGLESVDLAMLSLNDMGVIQTCSPTCEQVFGYRTDELAGHHVSTLLPELVDTELVMEDRINARIAFLCHCAIPFKARRRDGNCFTSELFINRLGAQNVVVLVRNLDTSR